MKKNFIIVFLCIVVLALAGTVGWFIGKDMATKNNEKTNDDSKEQSVVQVDYDFNKAKELVDIYATADLKYNFFRNEYDDESFKVSYALKYYIKSNNYDIETEKISKSLVDSFCSKNKDIYACEAYLDGDMYLNLDTTNYSFSSNYGEAISYDVINAVYKKLYGNSKNIDKSLKKISSLSESANYIYINDLNKYVKIYFAGGGVFPYVDVYGIKNTKIDGNNLIVDVGFISLEYDGDKCVGTINEKKLSNLDCPYTEKAEKEFLNEYLNQLDTYRFTFFMEDGIYKLADVKKS